MNGRPEVHHGLDVIGSDADDSRAILFQISAGAGSVVLPQSLRGVFDRLATNEPVALSDRERAEVERAGVTLADATDDVRRSEATKALANGIPADAINARPPTPRHYRPMQPLRVTRSFIPNRKSY